MRILQWNRKREQIKSRCLSFGQAELDLVAASGYSAFTPRLPEQPIFYPVLTREYTEQIARDWNTKDERSGYAGYVTEFAVDADY